MGVVMGFWVSRSQKKSLENSMGWNPKATMEVGKKMIFFRIFNWRYSGSTISTLLHDKINPKNCQVLSLGDTGFLQFFRVVSRDYGTPRYF